MPNNHQLGPQTVLDGKYKLKRLLGSGATGVVWLAETNTGATVACKILHGFLANKPRVFAKLRRESEILGQLTHAGITRQIEFNDHGPFTYLVLEYIDGQPLHEVLGEHAKRQIHLPGSHVRAIFSQLCDALSHAHSKYIVHRDVKPQNIMVVRSGDVPEIKVLDFGHARLVEGSIFDATTVGRTLGSPLYMSPEQARGEPATMRSDVFALATVLFELLTLHRAWVRDEHERPLAAFVGPAPAHCNNLAAVLYRIARGPRPRARHLRPQLHTAVADALERALAIDPDDRPASIHDLREAVWPGLVDIGDAPSPLVTSDFLPIDLAAGDAIVDPTLSSEFMVAELASRPSDHFDSADLEVPTESASDDVPADDTLLDNSLDVERAGGDAEPLDEPELPPAIIKRGKGRSKHEPTVTLLTPPKARPSEAETATDTNVITPPPAQPNAEAEAADRAAPVDAFSSGEALDPADGADTVQGRAPFVAAVPERPEVGEYHRYVAHPPSAVSMAARDGVLRTPLELAPIRSFSALPAPSAAPEMPWTPEPPGVDAEHDTPLKVVPSPPVFSDPAIVGARAPSIINDAIEPSGRFVRIRYRDIAWALVSVAVGLLGITVGLGLRKSSAPPKPSIQTVGTPAALQEELDGLRSRLDADPANLMVRRQLRNFLKAAIRDLPAEHKTRIEQLISGKIEQVKPADFHRAGTLLIESTMRKPVSRPR